MNASGSPVAHVFLVALATGALLSGCGHSGSETSPAVSAANAPAANVSSPNVSGQPQPLVVRAGSPAMFTVSAAGSAPLH
jgi:hypothetical protein